MQAIESENISDWADPLEDTYAIYRDSKDFKYQIDRINELSKLIEIKGGRDLKSIAVAPDGSVWFCTTVGIFRIMRSK